MSDKQERLLGYLSQAEGWVTAAELSEQLGVSTRSVRSYVTTIKASAAPLEVLASSTSGYRLNRDVYSAFVASRRAGGAEVETPKERIYHLLRRLAEAPEGVNVYALASSMFVSESTIESDLRKLRPSLDESSLALDRTGDTVRITGSEYNLRRLLSRMFRDEGAQGFLELASIEREFQSSDLRGFKTDLIAMLDSHGYFVNEYGINNVLLHVAIAVDRKSKSQLPADGATAEGELRADYAVEDVAPELAALVERRFGVVLGPTDLDNLALLLTTRVITRGVVEVGIDPASGRRIDRELASIRRIVERVSEEYLVDLDDEEFIVRLALHVSNLIARAQGKSYSRNPMTRSIKTSYPMIYELAVFIASEIQRHETIVINDDEISYIALHVGSYLERQSRREQRVTCAIVCPNYYDMHLILRERLEAVLGAELQVDIVITRTDVDWNELQADLVLTTISSASFADNVVVIQPFLTEGDVEVIRRAVGRVRRQRRRIRLKEDLLLFFDESLFLRNVSASSEVDMIRILGERMIASGVIDEAYVDGAIERELMSSTAFTDNLAVPHAMAMTASRTAICIAVNETPMPWGENRVNVVALIAFSANDRTTFQAIFDQFVSVFADRNDVKQLVSRATDFPSLIEEIVRGIDR
ncbi:MAG: transcription antiterminator [Microbacteriaceae bacterium]|jgi:lichenan operon transcriptional antiterminator|nr:transcription antiterminator [Microbacteriaceae bacterium]HEV7956184.1 PTS sugar transporter subunit IIA [Marisediminicola sp.]